MNKLSNLARMGVAHKAFGNPIPQQAYDLIDLVEKAIPEFNPQLKVDKEVYKGHNTLADMISAHIHVWRSALNDRKGECFSESDREYYDHELKALADIEAAVNAELGE